MRPRKGNLRRSAMEFVMPRCIRGYHVYEEIWQSAVGEKLPCRREPDNRSDRYAVAVIRNETIVGHLPRKILKISSLFLRRGGSIYCIVTGRRRYSSDLIQGGLEIPCDLLFTGTEEEIKKLKLCVCASCNKKQHSLIIMHTLCSLNNYYKH